MTNIMPLFSHEIVKKLDKELEGVFKNTPHLPSKAVEILVKIAPYLILVSGLFMITGGLSTIFGTSTYNRMMTLFQGTPSFYFYLIGILQILVGIISIMAYKPLKNKEADGWYMLFCLNILELAMNLISVAFLRHGLFGLLLSLIVSFYILYEVKAEYLATIVSTAKKIVTKIEKIKVKSKK
jgi:uncharacterized membrane protein HdeD (DUF308 family)